MGKSKNISTEKLLMVFEHVNLVCCKVVGIDLTYCIWSVLFLHKIPLNMSILNYMC